jgi:penicillin-binding protein 1B
MSRRSSPKRKKRQVKRNPFTEKVSGLQWFQIIIIVFFCTAAYVVWLDYRVKSEFEGRRWALPARVYAQPLELFTGLQLNRQNLVQTLQELGYRQVKQINGTGEYQLLDDLITLSTRSFKFWDSEETSRRIQIKFSGNAITKIINVSGSGPLSIIRLDPQLIGKIYPEHNEDRVLLAYEDVPPLLVDALIAVEDRNFYKHFGIDLKGILRAIWTNISTGDLRQGGSTLTQQLVKNYFLSHERTFRRKFNELIMAILLERRYSKIEILSAYINEVYLGQHGARSIHGFGTAAEYYFARPINELRIDQLVMLVGIVRGASYYNPRRHPIRATKRRNLAISLMLEQGYLSEQQAQGASAAKLGITEKPGWSSAKYPAFMDLVRRQLYRDYKPEDLRTEGLRIFTTLNPAYQEIADITIYKQINKLEAAKNLPKNVIEGAGVITNIDTGEVLALIGGRYKQDIGFNRALDASRPVGSLIKPAVYLTALTQPEKYNVLTLIDDLPVNIKQKGGKSWVPKNYDDKVHGTVPLYIALAKSYNLATIQLGMQLGILSVKKTLRQLGIETAIPEYPSLFLGSLELSPLQVTQMYQTLASGGFQIPLKTIRAVLDKHGNPLQRYPLNIKQTLDSGSVFLVKFLLSEVVNQGTAKILRKKLPDLIPLAGKTGTTNDLRDSWFAGFGDNILAVIWLGRDDNQPARLTGASGALEVWIDIMRKINPKPLSLLPPQDVQWMDGFAHSKNGDDCSSSKRFPYIQPYLPVQTSSCKQEQPLDKQTDNNPWSILNM